jgi:hypothetical protein
MKIRKVISCILLISVIFGSINVFSPTKAFAAENVIHVAKNYNGQFVDTENLKNSLQGHLLQGQVWYIITSNINRCI